MNNAPANSKSAPAFLVDKVITPFADYIVASFKDPGMAEHPENVGGVLDFSGEYVFQVSPQAENLEACILGFIRQHMQLEIKAHRSRKLNIDLPGGSLGYLLSDESIKGLADIVREREVLLTNELRQDSGCFFTEDPLPAQEYASIFKKQLPFEIWNQLIRESSRNHLPFNYDDPPLDSILDNLGRGLAVIDSGMRGNCGFGVSRVFVYQLLSSSPRCFDEKGIFMLETLQLKHANTTAIQPLPPSAHNPAELSELRKRGQLVVYDNWLMYVDQNSGSFLNNPPIVGK